MKLTIEITDDIQDFNEYVTVTKTNGDLVEGIYKITLLDFINEVNGATVDGQEDDMIETPVLPQNCLKFVWKNLKKSESDIYIVVPKMRRDITFFKNEIKQVGFPRMIFKYRVEQKKVSLLNIVALKGSGPIRLDTPLFHFPYSHVSTGGNVCMGGNIFPEIERIQQLGTFHNLFLSSPFSTDYGSKSTLGKSVSELFDFLANKDFDDEWLLPNFESKQQKEHATLGSYFKLQTI